MDSPYYMTSQKLNWTSECCWSWSVAAIFIWHAQTIARTIAHGNYRMGVRILTWKIRSSIFNIFGKIVWISINITCWLTKNGKYTKIGVPWTDIHIYVIKQFRWILNRDISYQPPIFFKFLTHLKMKFYTFLFIYIAKYHLLLYYYNKYHEYYMHRHTHRRPLWSSVVILLQ